MQRRSRQNMLAWIFLIIYVLASSIGMVLIKKGGNITKIGITKSDLSVNLGWQFLIGILFYVISFLLWIVILQMFKLTYISPIAYGITYVCIMFFSSKLLNETVSFKQLVGVALIILGIIISTPRK